MHRLGWFLFGAVSVCALALVAGGLLLRHADGFSANQPPGQWETWIARGARAAALPTEAQARANPLPNTGEVLAEARAHWADHCAVCHANDGSGDTPLGKRSYPPAPDMRLPATQQQSDGALFYTIQNGIRLSGMPGWGGGTDHEAQDSWKLVHFIRHLPRLTVEEKAEMAKLNPKSPEEIKEEQEETNFLKGNDSNEQSTEHHHH